MCVSCRAHETGRDFVAGVRDTSVDTTPSYHVQRCTLVVLHFLVSPFRSRTLLYIYISLFFIQAAAAVFILFYLKKKIIKLTVYHFIFEKCQNLLVLLLKSNIINEGTGSTVTCKNVAVYIIS